MKFLDPLTTQPPSFFTAVVRVPEESERRQAQSIPMRPDARRAPVAQDIFAFARHCRIDRCDSRKANCVRLPRCRPIHPHAKALQSLWHIRHSPDRRLHTPPETECPTNRVRPALVATRWENAKSHPIPPHAARSLLQRIRVRSSSSATARQ